MKITESLHNSWWVVELSDILQFYSSLCDVLVAVTINDFEIIC